ncbi:MAG: ABC transporter substrate-binding protein [Anaerolineales bacterium]
MKSRFGAILALVVAIAMVLSGCATPATATPKAAQGATEPTPQAEVKTYVVATDAAFPPMEFVDENKNITGFDIDLLNAIADEMGFKVEYKNTAWDGIFAGLESGDYDAIISAVTIREDRQEKYDFTDPYINAGQAIVVTVDNTTITGKADLEGKVIGTQIGTTGTYTAQEIANATVKEYDTIDLAFMDLVGGLVDAVIVDTPVAADFALTSDEYAGKLKIVGEPITEEYYGALVKKGENADFIAAFNEGLAKIKASGKYDEIYAKWIGGATSTAESTETSASGVPPSPGVPIKIAILAPFSGDVKTFGESTRDGIMMAIDEATAAGWQIETVMEDSKCDPQEAANAANKVIFENGVHYILGEVCSSASTPVSEIAEANGVVMVTGPSTSEVITVNEDGSTKDYVFRACFIDPFQGRVMAQVAVNDLGAKTAGVLYDVGNDYTKGLSAAFIKTFTELGGQIVVEETYTKDDTDFSAILGKVAAANPDVLFLPDYYAKNNLIAAQAKEKGITATFLGGDGWDSPDLAIEYFEGGYFSNHYSPEDPRPILQNFVAAYKAKYGSTPDSFATLGYDAARVLLQGISEAGVDDPSVVKDTLAKIKYEGVSGTITYDAQHNPVKNAAVIKIENGKQTFFKSVAPTGASESTTGTESTTAAVPKAIGVPIKIAVLAPLSGDVKTFGESTRNGALMAFEEAKAAGWEIEPIIADSKCDPQEAANAANKVVFEDGVHYILGEVCSSASIPISEIAEANGVVQVTPASTSMTVTLNDDDSTKEYVYRACFTDPFQGRVMAQVAIDDLGAKTAGVLYDVGNDYTKGLAEAFIKTFTELGGKIVVEETYTKDDTDFSAVLGKVAAADPDVLFLPDYYAKNNLIAAQAKEKGITATFLGGDGWDSPDLAIEYFEGGYFSNHYSPEDPRPVLQAFVAAYKAKYGSTPDALATLGYDAARLLLQGISEAGVDDPEAVKDALANIKYEGVSGTITYDEQHNPIKNAAVNKIVNGKPVFFKSVAP